MVLIILLAALAVALIIIGQVIVRAAIDEDGYLCAVVYAVFVLVSVSLIVITIAALL